MVDKKFVDNLSPEEIDVIKSYIGNVILSEDIETSNSDNLVKRVCKCPYCSSKNYIRHGYNGKRQRYRCKDCKKSFSSTNKTIFYRGRISYQKWLSFIFMELSSNKLRPMAAELDINVKTAFHMRHRLYDLIGKTQDKTLSGIIEADFSYEPINLKRIKKG